MALMVTFPGFVHVILATEIQRNEQAEREGQTAERNVREDIGTRYDIRSWKSEVSEMMQHLMLKKHTQNTSLSMPKEPYLP